MKERVVLSNREGWKAVSHPLRLAILGALMEEELSNEELARALGQQSGKLYFHTKKLLDAGLIEVARTRQKGPRTEKLYRRTARHFNIEVGDGQSEPPLSRFVQTGLELYEREHARNPSMAQLGYQMVYSHTPTQNSASFARLKALMEEFKDSADHGDADDVVAMNIVLLMHTLD